MLSTMLYLLANERPLINIDITLLLNLGLWLALYVFLRATFWGPMLALISAREQGIEGSITDSRVIEAEALAIRAKFEVALRDARAEAARVREKLRSEGARQEADIQQGLRAEVNAMIEKSRAELAVQREGLRAEVLVWVPALAREITRKILPREVSS